MSSLPSRRPTTLAALALVFAGGIAVACTAPSPDAATEPPSKSAEAQASKSPANRNGPTLAKEPFREFQVEKEATVQFTASAAPRYPDKLREQGIEGQVLAQFVVNRDGTPDLSTFKVLKSDQELFTQAVQLSLPNMRFNPAMVGGKPVRQLVQMPFSFSLAKTETGAPTRPRR